MKVQCNSGQVPDKSMLRQKCLQQTISQGSEPSYSCKKYIHIRRQEEKSWQEQGSQALSPLLHYMQYLVVKTSDFFWKLGCLIYEMGAVNPESSVIIQFYICDS